MSYPADPGGVFATDVHRRVLGHLPLPGDDPTSVEALHDRLSPDAHTDLDGDELASVLEDLEADGHVGQTKAGWKQTKRGFDALTGPNGGDV